MGRYSLDLRERVLPTHKSGDHSIRQVAETFNVHRNTVQAWIYLKRSIGHLRPEAARGKPSQLVGQEKAIETMISRYPDYILQEYCEYWREEQGVDVSVSSMCQWLQQQCLSLKKDKT